VTKLVTASGVPDVLGRDTFTVGPFRFTPTGLIVEGDPPFEEWERIGDYIRLTNQGCQWWWGDWLRYGEARTDYGERFSQALEASPYEERTLGNLKYVAENVPPSRRRDDVEFSVHFEAASLTPSEQKRFLARAAKEGWTRAEARREKRLVARQSTADPTPLDGVFRVVYADPPWSYGDSGVVTGSDAYGKAERHYPTQSIADLCAVPVIDHVADNAVLFLWVTTPILAECWPVITAWGFTYKTSLVWDKVRHNFGHYVSVRHEHLLICTRGSCLPDRPTPMPDSVQTIRRSSVHSEKPEDFRQLIVTLYDGPYLELFGRKEVAGWTIFGNQNLTTTSSP
jgi:N6-adenosine-specific RNA methylase IME4